MCEEALDSDFVVEALFHTPQLADSERGDGLIVKAQGRSIEIIEVTPRDLNKFTDTVHSQGVSALLQIPEPKTFPTEWEEPISLLALDAIGDPGNLGTIIRTADWFALDGILLGAGCVELYNPKVIRSTMGSVFHLPIYDDIGLDRELAQMKSLEFRICAGDAHKGTPIEEFEWPSKMVLVVGSEPRGIDPKLHELIDNFVHIPKFGQAESLNAATATGILLFSIAGSKKNRMTRQWKTKNF